MSVGTASNTPATFTTTLGGSGTNPTGVRASANQAAVTTTGSLTTTPYGYASAAQADAIVTLVNELRLALIAAGIIKGSA